MTSIVLRLVAGFVSLIGAAFVVCAAEPSGGADVSFPVADARVGVLELRAKLWLPVEPPSAAVILLHGSGGWSDHREGHYARAFTAAGLAVLAVDSFGPRGIARTVEDQSRLSSLQMARDAFAAGRYLRGRGFRAERLALMGFSKGGAGALFAADKTFLSGEPLRFGATLAFYPGCGTRARVPQPSSPVFIALGEKDDYSGVEPCQELASAFRTAGGTVTVTVYPDAGHAFDGDPARTAVQHLRTAENYINCRVLVEPDGRSSLGGQSFAPNDPLVLARLRSTCMHMGATVWTNPDQKKRATQDAIHFLRPTFAASAR